MSIIISVRRNKLKGEALFLRKPAVELFKKLNLFRIFCFQNYDQYFLKSVKWCSEYYKVNKKKTFKIIEIFANCSQNVFEQKVSILQTL